MKRLLFTKLYLLSLKEKKAKIIKFHPHMTIIRGENSTGKSSLVKMIYQAIGASVPNIPKNFLNADVISLLYFTIDGEEYSILKHQKRYILFQGNSKILSTLHITTELSAVFAKIFNFKLHLTDQHSNFIQATPAFMFLPFYLDQDQGWQEDFKSFNQLNQFSNWKNDFISFYLGITPPEYYIKKEKMIQTKEILFRVNTRYEALYASRDEILKKFNVQQIFDFNIEDFGESINKLMIYANELKQNEDKYLEERHALNSELMLLTSQKIILEKARQELQCDFAYSTNKLPDEIECPFCHTKHNNSFAVRFGLAVDETRCDEMLVEISEKISLCNEKLINLQKNISNIIGQKSEIQQLLQNAQKGITLEQIIKASGKKEIDIALSTELQQLSDKENNLQNDIDTYKQEIKKLLDPGRKKRIELNFENKLKENYRLLNMPEVAMKQKGIGCVCKHHSGSDRTRVIWGYFWAFISMIEESKNSCMCPIVIDSPKQSDLDQKNWDSMLILLKNRLSSNNQCILSVVEHSNIEFDGDEIILDKPWNLLTTDDYFEASSLILPLLNLPEQPELFSDL